MSANSEIPLYLFAKAPIAGSVKTRMQPYLSPEQSAGLAKLMIEQSVDQVKQFWPGDLVLTVSPDNHHSLFSRLAKKYNIEINVQIEGDLGQRMMHVLHQGILRHGSAVVMGCDVPHIPGDVLRELHVSLLSGQEVVGPAKDGGFYILGLTSIGQAMFDDIQWGGGNVLSVLEVNSRKLGISLKRCVELIDIDTWDDLQWLARKMPEYQQFVD